MSENLPPAPGWEGSSLALQRRRRILPRIALTTALVLAAEMALLTESGQAVALAPQSSRAAAEKSVPEVPPVPSEAADILSAKVAARLSGIRVEALSERTETSTTWVNKNGSLTTELSSGPVRFEENGSWTDIDVELRETADGVEAKAHPGGLRLGSEGGRLPRS